MEKNINTLLEENKGLVGFVISKWFPIRKNDDDFFQEGLIGLWDALKTFDESKGAFSPFAVTCIKRRLIAEMRRNLTEKRTLDQPNICASLESTIITDSENLALEEALGAEDQNYKIIEIHEYIANQNERDKRIIAMKIAGHKTQDVAKHFNLSGQTIREVWNKLKREVA